MVLTKLVPNGLNTQEVRRIRCSGSAARISASPSALLRP